MTLARNQRFVVLDSLRGICACIVAIYHLEPSGILTTSALVRSGWLFVDFFFVLSGFVIAGSYGKRLAEGFPIGRFMFLRLGRVYPLHIAALLGYLVLELIPYVFPGLALRPLFTGTRTAESLVTNVFLLHVFGFEGQLTWNWPSWSIAAEMWTYLLFAIALRFAGTRIHLVLIMAIIAAPIALSLIGDGTLEKTYAFSVIRCVYGFALGVIGHGIFARFQGSGGTSGATLTWSVAEVLMVVACILFVVHAEHMRITLLCPPLFLAAVLMFACERGAISTLLKARLLVLLGTLSYSIYMVHSFVEGRVREFLTVIEPALGIDIISVNISGGTRVKMLVGPGIVPDLMTIAVLLAVIGAAALSYHLIETPFRNLSRRLVARDVSSRPAEPKLI